MNQIRIGLGCRARQGKDTVAIMFKEIFEQHGLSVRIDSFAKPLYEAYYNACLVSGFDSNIKDRKFLQLWGDKGRNIDPNYWVNKAISRIEPDVSVIIITDIRYLNELEQLKKNIFDCVNVIRPDSKGATDGIPNHDSENGIDSEHFDYEIINDGSLNDLRKNIETICWKKYLTHIDLIMLGHFHN